MADDAQSPATAPPATETTPAGAPRTQRPPGFRARRATTPRPSPASAPAQDGPQSPPAPPEGAPTGPVGARARTRLRDRFAGAELKGLAKPRTSSSTASTDTVRNVTNLCYTLVKGGTKIADRVLRKRFPATRLEASAGEARDIARPMARMIARRVAWEGDASDALDGLWLFIYIGGYVANRAGIDIERPEAAPDWDAELHGQIADEVRAVRRERAPADVDERPPPAPQAPPQPADARPAPARRPEPAPGPENLAEGRPVLLADALAGAWTPPAREELEREEP